MTENERKGAKPILFNTPMVQAILDNRKTVTRRVVKPQPNNRHRRVDFERGYLKESSRIAGCWSVEKQTKSPYEKGDILYVRETFVKLYDLDGNDQVIEGTGKTYYAADNPDFPYTYFVRDDGTHKEYPAWKPSIHMPKEAARIFLRVTDVRLERLQDVTEAQAKKEGCELIEHVTYCNAGTGTRPIDLSIERFTDVWESRIKKKDLDQYGWYANPWVWVIEFERIEL